MEGFEHLLSPDEVSDMLDEIASADPPSFLRRCFAEGCSSPRLSWARTQELALFAVVLDSIISRAAPRRPRPPHLAGRC